MTVHIAIQNESVETSIPDENNFTQWTNAAFSGEVADIDVTIRIVDEKEGRSINNEWRKKDYATNVLSFPIGEKLTDTSTLLGDIVICAPVVKREANEQNKMIEAHWAHLVIHGMLHLQGFDHEDETDANIMETKEITILNQFGYANPYESSA